VGGVKNLFAPKFRGTLTVTSADGSTHTIKNLDFRTVMAGNCGQIPMFSLMPAASYDDGLLDFEIIDTTGGILGWAHRASVPKSHWKSRPKRRWTATCYRRPNIFVSQWIIAR